MEIRDDKQDYELGQSELIILTLSLGSVLAALHFLLSAAF